MVNRKQRCGRRKLDDRCAVFRSKSLDWDRRNLRRTEISCCGIRINSQRRAFEAPETIPDSQRTRRSKYDDHTSLITKISSEERESQGKPRNTRIYEDLLLFVSLVYFVVQKCDSVSSTVAPLTLELNLATTAMKTKALEPPPSTDTLSVQRHRELPGECIR